MLRTIALMGTLTAVLLAIGWLVAGLWGMGIALAFAVIINFVSYWYSDRIVLRMYGAEPSEDKELNKMVAHLAEKAKIPRPRVYTVPLEVPNAFATGRNPRNSAVVVTQGLMDLDREELEGVLAHEVSHIKNRDIMVSMVAATLAGAISYIAQIGYWSLFMAGQKRGEGNIMGLILILVFAPLAALLIRFAISRSRELKADWSGALLTKNPQSLANALKKISEVAREKPIGGTAATSHLWIVNPLQRDWFTSLFSTHPPVEVRVRRLEDMEV